MGGEGSYEMNFTSFPKHFRWYLQIIDHARKNPPTEYSEKHHIIPDSFVEFGFLTLDELNEKSNIVRLSARQHFVCHILLRMMFEKGTEERKKMTHALWWLRHDKKHNDVRLTSTQYEFLKLDKSKQMTERNLEAAKNGTNPFQSEKVRQQTIARNKTPTSRNAVSNRLKIAAQQGTHPSQSLQFREQSSNLQKEKVEKGTHPFQDPEFLIKMGKRTAQMNKSPERRLKIRIRWAKWRKNQGKSKPGDDELLAIK